MLTKSQQVEKYLRSAILSGRWNVGENLPSERELLAELGVSRTTLRDALSILANDGLILRKHKSGTCVADRKSTGKIVLLARADTLLSRTGLFHQTVIRETRSLLESEGYRAQLVVADGNDADSLISSVHLFDPPYNKDILGVITYANTEILREKIEEMGVPAVCIDYGLPYSRHSVFMDYPKLTDAALSILKSKGYSEFALMHFGYQASEQPISARWMEGEVARISGLVEGFQKDWLVPVKATADCHGAYDAFKEWWARRERPNVMFFYDDGICTVATRAMLELGVRVPEDLKVITMSVSEREFLFPVPLTRIEFDPMDTARAAWSMMRGLLSGDEATPSSIGIGPQVREGESL